jgi:hypothetical protein
MNTDQKKKPEDKLHEGDRKPATEKPANDEKPEPGKPVTRFG